MTNQYHTALAFLSHINDHTTIITPNRRLSATLHKHYQQLQIEKGKQYWQTPEILPASIWIQRLFNDFTSQEFIHTPLLLSNAQEQFLWETILSSTKYSAGLLQLSETAEMARSAWNLLQQWRIDLNEYDLQNEDSSALLIWVQAFKKICLKKNWVDHAVLPDLLAKAIQESKIKPPKQIILFGFTELSPQLNYLLSLCEIAGSHIRHELPKTNGKSFCISLSDQQEEILTLARFAKSTLNKHPNAQIGCVIPTLDKIRDRVQQIFSEVFADETTYTTDLNHQPFNISAGKNLLQYPIINTVFQLLALHKKTISIETFSYLLSSPFLGAAEKERVKRAHVDSHLRRVNMNTVDLLDLLKEGNHTTAFSLHRQCPEFAKRIQAFVAALPAPDTNYLYSEWARTLNHLLSILGWPGERILNSEEFQIVSAWLQLLNDFSALDHVAEPVSLSTAIYTLHKMARKLIFQPKTPEAPIQVLGILEAAALPFDYLWISGMDDLSWPPQPRPNPLIPKALQRKLNMPHATAERELVFCETITQQFKDSAEHVIFSHASKNDELELQASPLIRNLPHYQIDQLHLENYQSPSERIYASKKIEILLDENAPALANGDQVTGGVNVIKLQALCPFKAFAECRLYARELESPLPGLRAKDRGTILHKVLELIWNEIQNHTTLINSSEETLNAIIKRHIDYTMTTIPHSHNHYPQYIHLEKQRLFKIICEWLQIEKEREPFQVSRSETKEQIKLNRLQLQIRIDRIDELANGKKFIIDYKTGRNNEIISWFSDRPEEPQLPLYALIDKQNTVGIAFAQIAPGESCFKGISHYALDIKGIKLVNEIKKSTALSWSEQLDQWSTILGKLSDDFYQGDARVDPKNSAQTCNYCAIKSLCRINEDGISPHDK